MSHFSLKFAVFFGVLIGGNLLAQPADQSSRVSRPGVNGTAGAEGLSSLFRRSSEAVLPTVVKIRGENVPEPRVADRRGRRADNPFQGTPLEDFFDDALPFGIDPNQLSPSEGLGSGVIIRSDGLVLTNNHVVKDFDRVVVELADGRQFDATDIRTDPDTDLAVLTIQGAGTLPAATLGDSDRLQTGDWVLAVGNPFGYDATVSVGIISAKGRQLEDAQLRAQFLQTDAAINPGNSGGPLVNLRGEVVGINTAIASQNGGFQGIGFAIPINLAKWVSEQLVTQGEVRRAFIGIQIQRVSHLMAELLQLPPGVRGVAVVNVVPEKPAALAGLEPGDVIVAFDQRPVNSPAELQRAVERVQLNDKGHNIEFIRDGKRISREVKITNLPNRRRPGDAQSRQRVPVERPSSLGLEVADMTSELLSRMGVNDLPEGVIVTAVEPGGLAAQAGIRPGRTIVLRVGKQSTPNRQAFETAIKAESLRKGLLLYVLDLRLGYRIIPIKRP